MTGKLIRGRRAFKANKDDSGKVVRGCRISIPFWYGQGTKKSIGGREVYAIG